MSATEPSSRISLAIPRHLQDYNGYCGPACAMMVLDQTDRSAPLAGQPELFRSIRAYAKESSDRRPIKSPAESLLALLAKQSGSNWKKYFDPEPAPIAERILRSIQQVGQPALILISKGMHWVVVFGRTLREDGSPAGVLLRDPAWAGMPAFFGLSIYPEKTTFTHSGSHSSTCTCLQSDHQAGTVHERYLAMDELLSPRGLQGTPDWEGRGAIALMVDDASTAAPSIKLGTPANGIAGAAAVAAAAYASPAEAALPQALEHGLYGRADSPADWKTTLENGRPGEPILVKDPDDPRDNFYLVPIISEGQKGPKGQEGLPDAANRTAWIMLDAQTLKLREASLLDNWKTPVFPTHQDTQELAEKEVTLPDGTKAQYRASELKPNQKNLVWKASAASILPYWPVKELKGSHPLTGAPVSIYITQEGTVYTELTPDEPVPTPRQGSLSFKWMLRTLSLIIPAVLAYGFFRYTNRSVEGVSREFETIRIKEVKVPVEVIKEVIKEVKVPVEVIKIQEVIKEVKVPIEVIKEVIKEVMVPVEVIKIEEVIKEVLVGETEYIRRIAIVTKQLEDCRARRVDGLGEGKGDPENFHFVNESLKKQVMDLTNELAKLRAAYEQATRAGNGPGAGAGPSGTGRGVPPMPKIPTNPTPEGPTRGLIDLE
jgi:hypothetical protein